MISNFDMRKDARSNIPQKMVIEKNVTETKYLQITHVLNMMEHPHLG